MSDDRNESAEKLERGFQARTLLESEFFRDCLNRLDATYIAAWKSANTVEAREDAHKYVRMMEWFVSDLTSIATTGTIEEARLAALEARRPPPLKLAEFIR